MEGPRGGKDAAWKKWQGGTVWETSIIGDRERRTCPSLGQLWPSYCCSHVIDRWSKQQEKKQREPNEHKKRSGGGGRIRATSTVER